MSEKIIEGEELKIYTYPDKILEQVAEPVKDFNRELHKLTQDMLYTMYHAPGIGLAAPQIGQSIRVFVLDVDYNREIVTNANGEEKVRLSHFNPHTFINPEIIESEGTAYYKEGCLSLPEVFDDVQRHELITLKYQDSTGQTHQLQADGLLSICIQHELDHLNGVVFIDRLSTIKKNLYAKKLKKRKRQR